MSRRKQTKPQHIESEDTLVSILENGSSSASQSEDEALTGDEHVCGKCRGEFVDLASFLGHKKHCCRKRVVFIVDDEYDDDLEEGERNLPFLSETEDFDADETTEAAASLDDNNSSSTAAHAPTSFPSNVSDDIGLVPSMSSLSMPSKCQEDMTNNNELSDRGNDSSTTTTTTCAAAMVKSEDDQGGTEDKTELMDVESEDSKEQTSADSLAVPGKESSGSVPLPHLPLLSPSLYSSAFPYDSSPALSSNVLLQSLPNTKVAVSQISAAAATVLNGDKTDMQSPAKASELVMLQSTLYSLQQQQMLQLQLIKQLQQQLIANNVNPAEVSASDILSVTGLPKTSSLPVHGAIVSTTATVCKTANSLATSPVTTLAATPLPLNPLIVPTTTTPPTTNSASSTSSSGSTIGNIGGSTILNVGSPSDLKEPNSLELLQRSAQQVLNNASQGLLAADLQFRNGSSKNGSKGGLSGYDSKTGHYSRSDDAFFKHRCRYCGKVFGSDSALQIHIRSHTGERPFKCNVCGNRFSTKGNLKVHFQRHKMKYPHIRMNPHPVPEHLDKYVIPLQPPSPVGPMMSQSLPSPTPHHHPHHHHHHHHHHRAHPLSIPPHLHSQFSPITPPPPSSSSYSALPPTSLAMDVFSKSLDDHHHHQRHQGSHRASSSHSFGVQMNDHTLVSSSLGLAPLPTTSRRTSDDTGSPPPPLLAQGLTSTPLALTTRPPKSDSPSSVITKAPHSPDISDDEEDMDDYDREDNDRRSMDGSPASHMQDEQYPDDDMDDQDDMDSISGESLMSHSMRAGRYQHHEGTSQPLPPSASLIEAHSSSRHSAPPIATFSSMISERSNKNEDKDGLTRESASDEAGDNKNYSRDEHQRRPIGSSGGGNAREGSERPGSPSQNAAGQDLTLDPAIYTPLLPKPGSNDNSWESLIEITKTSETSKLQQLVDNIEHKLSDPNQCVICNRVLSCKSALQMHYRTHTGERPFKCKICGRAFTTKGNLKTHMGVHRAKPPMRVLHQCPVCHKKFTNALVLQQHIRMHTGEPTDMTPEQIQAAEIKEYSQPHMGHPGGPSVIIPTTLPHLFTPMSLSMAPLGSPMANMMKGVPLRGSGHSPAIKTEPGTTATIPKGSGAASPASSSSTAGRSTCTPNQNTANRGVIRCGSAFSEGDKDMEQDRPRRPDSHESPAPPTSQPSNLIASFSTSLAALENHVKNISTPPPSLAQFGHLMAVASGALPPQHRSIPEDHHHPHHHHNQHSAIVAAHHHHSNRHRRHSEHGHNGTKRSPELRPPQSPRYHDEDNVSERTSPSVKRETESPRVPTNECSMPGSPRSPSPTPSVSSLTNSEASISASALDLTPRSSLMSQSLSALGSMAFDPSNPSGLGLVPSLGSLPISMVGRSNTTCNICLKTFACNSALEIHYRSHTKERPFKCDVCDRAFSTKGNMKQHMLTHKIRDLPAQFFDKGSESMDTTQSSRPSPPPPPPPQQGSQISPSPAAMAPHLQMSHHQSVTLAQNSSIGRGDGSTSNRILGMMAIAGESPSKRPASDLIGGDHLSSNPKRSSSLSKHLCHVCNKNFSSASALQIHMRTHTGDKPFKCNVCERAFTTKGNLKVHMGTHMWNNGASRRGRRMSIELPPLPLTPKDGDYHLSRRPEHLYFPYLASPFLNGMTTKMNEISVIQSAVLSNGGLVSSPAVSMAMAAAAASASVLSSSTTTTTDSAATALRHSTELDLSCKKSPLPAEGARSSPSPNSCSPSNKSSAPTAIRLTCGNGGKLSATPLSSRSPSPAMSPPGREETPLGSSINGPWVWKMSCNVCHKVFTSPNELENHLKAHYKTENKDHLGDIPKTEGLPV